jgi:Uma2 family endonuclease
MSSSRVVGKTPQDPAKGTAPQPAAVRSPGHQPLVERIHAALDEYVTSRKLGRLWRDIDVVLDRRAGLVVQPDIIFIVDGRESIVSGRVWGPPDMVLEVTSPLTYSGALGERVSLFSMHGVREYWLVQPELREVALLELAHGGVRRRVMLDDKTPIRTTLFPEFDQPLAKLLAG